MPSLRTKKSRRSSFSAPSQKTNVTFDPLTDSFSVGTQFSIHQRNMFVNHKLAPSLRDIKNEDVKGCNSKLCSM